MMLELISIHIHKTAGTSFERTLKDVYGENAVLRMDRRPMYRGTEKFYSLEQKAIPQQIKVIHGHFIYSELISYFDLPENIPVITWLRDPVERTISSYYYHIRDLNEDLQKAKVGAATYRKLKRLQNNLIQFSSRKGEKNRMARYLKGISLEHLFFVGIVEHYTEDLAHLAKLLHWKDFQRYEVNVTEKPKVNKKTRKIIKRYNKVDYNLYKQALYFRRKRVGTISASDKIRYFSHRTAYFIQKGLINKVRN